MYIVGSFYCFLIGYVFYLYISVDNGKNIEDKVSDDRKRNIKKEC